MEKCHQILYPVETQRAQEKRLPPVNLDSIWMQRPWRKFRTCLDCKSGPGACSGADRPADFLYSTHGQSVSRRSAHIVLDAIEGYALYAN